MEYFPKIWATGKITPVFKKGDITDPNNYRGITILSCLCKLFTKVMNERLNRWAEEEKILTDTQYGFRKNRGTTDCLFILKGLVDIVFSRGMKLYVCFVDYQKAYDLLDRSCLFHKLTKEGVSSKCVNLFKDLYSKMKLKVITDKERRSFASNVGLLQGETSSPILFSLFVNDLEKSLTGNSIGVDIIDILIKILMFADDMIILSTTVEGLQNGLNNLSDYCKKWGLTVNISKTKVMVFRKGGKLSDIEKWFFNGILLDVVASFNYLGCEISSTGSFKKCVENLVSSANRALFSLKRYFSKNKETLPEVQIRLFDSMVAPITFHGSEVWGLRKADLIEKFHLSFLKSILRVKLSTTNCYVYGELGIFPFVLERKLRVVKYWLKIIRSLNQNENYIQKIYKELLKINIEKPQVSTWVSEIKRL